MKCLYQKDKYVALDSDRDWKKEYCGETVYYGELPEEKIISVKYDDLESYSYRVNHYKSNLFRKKEYKNYYSWISCVDIDIYPGDLLLEKYVYREIEDYSLDDLSKKMNAQDFIQYLKDNGMNTCPVMK